MPSPGELAAHAARLRALPFERNRYFLLRWAACRGVPEDVADDALQRAAMILIRTGAGKWKHENDPTAYFFLRRRMRRAFDKASEKAEVDPVDRDTDLVEESPPSSDPGAARVVLARDEATRQREELLRRLADNPLAVEVVQLCMREGEMRPSEIAVALNEPVARIYECQRRISNEIGRMIKASKRAEDEEALG